MAITINTDGFAVNFAASIDKRLIVDRVAGTTASLVSLEPNYNYRNMYVWVREEKAFYYLKDIPAQGGATSSDWTKLLSGSSSSGTASAIDITEVAFGTGTGVTSSRNFTFATSSTTLIFGSGSTIASSSRLSAIIGGCNNTIGTASVNSGIFGGRLNTLGTSSQSVIIGGQCNTLSGTSSQSSIIGGQCNTLSGTLSNSSIIGGQKNTLSATSTAEISSSGILGSIDGKIISSSGNLITGGAILFSTDSCIEAINSVVLRSSIISGRSNKIKDGTQESVIIGGCNNYTKGVCYSSIIGGEDNKLFGTFPKNANQTIFGSVNSTIATSSLSSIISSGNSTIYNSTSSVIIGGTGLSLNNEQNVVYVPNLKIASASNVSADRILVWDTDNLVKYRDSSTLGGVGSIKLEPNAGLTNSGTTYATIYNTTVTETTNVPGTTISQTSPENGLHPLTWLRGLTAGYFSQKNIVEVLDMILFPAVPFAYTAPSLSISSSPSLPSGIVLVNINQYTSDLTLTYNDGNPNATASQYSWLCSVNGGSSYNLIGSVCDSTSLIVTKPSINFPINSPIKYVIYGTVSHQASTIMPDTAGNPTPLPLANQAGICASGTIAFCSIFPYYYGRVDCNTNSANFDAGSISTTNTAISCRVSSCACNNLCIPAPGFNTTQCQKGFLAVPQSLGHQNQVFFNKAVDQCSNTTYPINNLHVPITNQVLFGGSSFSVPGVVVNGVSHTYSVYLFQYGSLSIADFVFSN